MAWDGRAAVWLLIAATGLAFYACFRIIEPFVPPLAWALALAIVTAPLHQRILARLERPNLAAGLAVLIVTVAIVAPTIFIAQELTTRVSEGVLEIPTPQDADRWSRAISRMPALAPLMRWFEGRGDLRAQIGGLVGAVIGNLSSILSLSLWAVTQLFISLFFLFFFFRDRDVSLSRLRTLMPLSPGETSRLFERIRVAIHATIYGTVVVALVQGFLTGLALWVLGIPAPVLWGFVTAVLALIPVAGSVFVWGPFAAVLISQGHILSGILLIAWGAGVVALIDNVLYPVLVGRELGLHTVIIFISLLGGVAVLGPSGLIIGPVIVSITVFLLEVWRNRGEEALAEAVQPEPAEKPAA